jgi:opacity protein-like surface antigen
MKTCYFVIVFFVFLSSITFSQDKKAEIFINGGISLPISPESFSDYWSMGYNIGGGAGYRFLPNLSGSLSLGYNSMVFDEEGFLKDFGLGGYGLAVEGADATILMVTANVKFSLVPTAPLSPYLIGGIGFCNVNTEDISFSYLGQIYVEQGSSASTFGAIIGAGVDIPVSPIVALFLEVDWGLATTEGDVTGYVPVKGGVLILL